MKAAKKMVNKAVMKPKKEEGFFNQDFDQRIVYWLLGGLVVLFILFITWRNQMAFM